MGSAKPRLIQKGPEPSPPPDAWQQEEELQERRWRMPLQIRGVELCRIN